MRFALLLMGSLFSVYASAGVYKCTAADGNTVYQSTPCETAKSKVEINPKTGVSVDLNAEQVKQQQEAEKQRQDEEKQKQAQQEAEQKAAQLKQEARNESEKNQLLIKNNPQQYSAFAIPAYDPESMPDMVRNYESRLPEIERFRRFAAAKALATQQCGRVEDTQLNIRSTKNALVFLVDCSSGKHFYFTEAELK